MMLGRQLVDGTGSVTDGKDDWNVRPVIEPKR